MPLPTPCTDASQPVAVFMPALTTAVFHSFIHTDGTPQTISLSPSNARVGSKRTLLTCLPPSPQHRGLLSDLTQAFSASLYPPPPPAPSQAQQRNDNGKSSHRPHTASPRSHFVPQSYQKAQVWEWLKGAGLHVRVPHLSPYTRETASWGGDVFGLLGDQARNGNLVCDMVEVCERPSTAP